MYFPSWIYTSIGKSNIKLNLRNLLFFLFLQKSKYFNLLKTDCGMSNLHLHNHGFSLCFWLACLELFLCFFVCLFVCLFLFSIFCASMSNISFSWFYMSVWIILFLTELKFSFSQFMFLHLDIDFTRDVNHLLFKFLKCITYLCGIRFIARNLGANISLVPANISDFLLYLSGESQSVAQDLRCFK